MNYDQIQDAIEDVKTWIGRSPASIDERYYEREALKAFDSLTEHVATLTTERDAARKELAELRSAPGIDEVDEILRDVNSSMFDNQERLASITRRAIASREEEKQRADEVAGLLKWWVSFKDGFGQLEGMSAGSAVEEWKDNARRILEIAEGE